MGPYVEPARTPWVRMWKNVVRPLARPLTAILSSLSIPISVRGRSADACEVGLKESACEVGLGRHSRPA